MIQGALNYTCEGRCLPELHVFVRTRGAVCSHGLQKFITFSMPPNVVTFPKTLETISYHMSLFMKFDFSIATNV